MIDPKASDPFQYGSGSRGLSAFQGLNLITSTRLHRLCPDVGFARLAVYAVHLPIGLAGGNIDTPRRIAAFLGQTLWESTRLTRIEENLAYLPAQLLKLFPRRVRDLEDARQLVARGHEATTNRVYAHKIGNGNEVSGDGFRYRGPHQLTGCGNYHADGLALRMPGEEEPDRAAAPDVMFRAAALFWNGNVASEDGLRLRFGFVSVAQQVLFEREVIERSQNGELPLVIVLYYDSQASTGPAPADIESTVVHGTIDADWPVQFTDTKQQSAELVVAESAFPPSDEVA